MNRTLLLSTVAGVALAAAGYAHAADLRMPTKAPVRPAPVPVFSWTGCYVGGHIGGGWGRSDVFNREVGQVAEAAEAFEPSNEVEEPPEASETTLTGGTTGINSSGFIFGGQVGCDYQFASNWVIGVQGSFAGTTIEGNGHDPAIEAVAEATNLGSGAINIKTRWIGDITGRLGYAGLVPQTLLYVKGGVAWKNERLNITPLDTEDQIGGEFSHTFTGWTVGGGFEWAFAPNWTVFAEYNHYDFGNRNLSTGTAETTIYALDVKERIDAVKVGVNFRFGAAAAPIAARY